MPFVVMDLPSAVEAVMFPAFGGGYTVLAVLLLLSFLLLLAFLLL